MQARPAGACAPASFWVDGEIPHSRCPRPPGLRDAIVTLLAARGLEPSLEERRELFATGDEVLLRRWLVAAATCASVAELLASTL